MGPEQLSGGYREVEMPLPVAQGKEFVWLP